MTKLNGKIFQQIENTTVNIIKLWSSAIMEKNIFKKI